MTSQLVLGNGFGVAVASDSAVTLEDDGSPVRTYETSDKIFPLPMPHRLAVLTAGSALLNGLPFDVLVKEWIRSLGDSPFCVSRRGGKGSLCGNRHAGVRGMGG